MKLPKLPTPAQWRKRSTADLATLATTTWSEAKQWEAIAYEHFFAVRDRGVPDPEGVVRAEIVAETAEALTGPWTDLAAAHRVD